MHRGIKGYLPAAQEIAWVGAQENQSSMTWVIMVAQRVPVVERLGAHQGTFLSGAVVRGNRCSQVCMLGRDSAEVGGWVPCKFLYLKTLR